jgi:alanyl-tRNA synthetase/REP element-mobilizing transposase RayT
MTSSEIRQSFLDFFKSKQHTIVPSSSLMPDSPNLLFTNAGMNQFVPIFLGQQPCPYKPGRAADTQKCIRAGGKHNDLEDVGLDTYHHTFFEMLGNWSFGDYFKREAIDWAWELVTGIWKFPKNRLYATVYNPDKSKNDPSDFDQEAWNYWAEKFRAAGLDPAVHIVNGNKKDNFWMMGETGPCGPCSEIHVDLTPQGDTKGALVNKGSAECIEIWNLVFIQFNANPDGTFTPLPAKHVDTGMGFERVTSIMQCTKDFTTFTETISNYETDVFRPIFDRLEKLSGKKYTSTLPKSGSTGDTEQEKIDVAFRVTADHIRTLSFAIADGILPGNNDRNYVLRRILRRAVKYGRTLGFHKPFFYELVDTLAEKMGHVFSEIEKEKAHVKQVILSEEESFNKTLDRGIELFNAEAEKMGSARASRATDRALAVGSGRPQVHDAKYSKRRLPHFERPWAKYMITFSTHEHHHLAASERDIVLESILYAHNHKQYYLYAACVMPDHVHLLIEPQIKETDLSGNPVFWSLREIFQGVKSASAHEINKALGEKGHVWQQEIFDRIIRGDSDLEEKFNYICRNPWDNNIVPPTEPYRWLWTPDMLSMSSAEEPTAVAQSTGREGACAPQQLSGDFAFKLYDTYGFPLDLTELLARERGLTVDTANFEKLMEEQRARARASQKKEVISVTNVETATPTKFIGFDDLQTEATVQEIVAIKDKTGVILNTSPFYAEMGGQVGDTGEITGSGNLWRVTNTQKAGNAFLHFIDSADAPAIGSRVKLSVDPSRRNAVQRHHTVTHLFHWALHEVASKDALQKGSYVGPEKLTFDFNSAPLTPQQTRDIEKLVNERIVENAPVSWTEISNADAKARHDITQVFGEKYGDRVRVVQIGGDPQKLNGYSMELCGGTHTRSTGEIGLFRIVGESAIAAGVRRIEAVAGPLAYAQSRHDADLLASLAGKINSPLHELEKKIETLLAHQKELEKQLKSAQQREAAHTAKSLVLRARPGAIPAIIENLGAADGDTLQTIADSLKSQFHGAILLAGALDGNVSLVAAVTPDFTAKIQAGKIIQAIAPIIGGKGGGRPESARGGGKDSSKVTEALAKAVELITQTK